MNLVQQHSSLFSAWKSNLEEASAVLVIMQGMCFKTLSTLVVSHIPSAVSSLQCFYVSFSSLRYLCSVQN